MLLELLILGIVIGSNNYSVALALGALGKAAQRYRVILVLVFSNLWYPCLVTVHTIVLFPSQYSCIT